jgi:hypothetical protein
MDQVLQSEFHQIRAIVFFDENKDQSWNINSSQAALQSLTSNIWNDDYYFGIPKTPAALESWIRSPLLMIYPNPSGGTVNFAATALQQYPIENVIRNMTGQVIGSFKISGNESLTFTLPPGIYLLETVSGNTKEHRKLIIE